VEGKVTPVARVEFLVTPDAGDVVLVISERWDDKFTQIRDQAFMVRLSSTMADEMAFALARCARDSRGK